MNREAKVGLFVILALAVMVFFVMRTGSVAGWLKGEEPLRQVKLRLDDASGIRVGTAVRVAGVKVGEVEVIELDSGQAIVMLSVPHDLQLGSSASASLKSQGVLGERFVALTPGGTGGDEQAELTASSSPSLDDITAMIAEIGKDLTVITGNLKESMRNSAGDNRITLIAENIENLTEALVAMVAENRGNVNTTTSDIADLAGKMKRDMPALITELTELTKEFRGITAANRQNIDQTMSNVTRLTERMNDTAASVSSIASKVDRGEGSIGKLVNDEETVDNLNNVLVKAEESLGEVQQLLTRVNDLEMNLHFRSEYLADAEASKNYFGVRLQPSDQKYYLLEAVVRDEDYLLSETITNFEELTYDANGDLITRTVRTSEEKEDDLVFTGQMAYRLGPIFLRGGLIEGEGGGGFDYLLRDDQIRFSLEAFDFNRIGDLSAHGKIDFSYQLTKGIKLNLGWDDFLESDRDSAYLGAGVRWKDDDLKILLGNIGSFIR